MTTEIPPRRVREAPIAYRSEGGIKVGIGGPTPDIYWLKYIDAFLLLQDLKTALKGVEIAGKQ